MINPFVGTWTYRSLLNDPAIGTDFDKLEFGRGNLVIAENADGTLKGVIGGPGWQLALYGGFGFGEAAWFRGQGVVDKEEWIYDYWATRVPIWPNSTPKQQRAALVGSVTRVIAHSAGKSPAGAVASFYAVLQG